MAMSALCNFTFCIRSNNLEQIEQELTRILEQSGSKRIPLPTLSLSDIEKRYRSLWQMKRELWIVSLLGSSSGWTIVKTFPQELLCQRDESANRSILSTLAMQMNCDTFYLGVYEYGGILVEANARGDIFISGGIGSQYLESGKFFGEQINSPEYGRFFLLDVPEEMQKAEQMLREEQDRKFEEREDQLLESYAQEHFPQMTPSEFEQWRKRFKENRFQIFEEEEDQLYEDWLAQGQYLHGEPTGSELFDAALALLLDVPLPLSYWNLTNLLTQVSNHQRQLAADGVRLLSFRPPEYYLQPNPQKTRRKSVIARVRNHKYCIRCDNQELLEQALSDILKQEGCRRIPLPAPRLSVEELSLAPYHLEHQLWILGLFPGASGWMIVKSFPEEILCCRAKDADRPRLSELAMQIGSDAFYLGGYKYGSILLETNARCASFVSGSVSLEHSEEGRFLNEQINSQETEKFGLLDLQQEVQRVKRLLKEEQERIFEQEQRKCEELMALYKIINHIENTKKQSSPQNALEQSSKEEIVKKISDLELEVSELHEEIKRGSCQPFDEAVRQTLCIPYSSWNLEKIVYQVYNNQQRLEAHGARLLYFQPAANHVTYEDDAL